MSKACCWAASSSRASSYRKFPAESMETMADPLRMRQLVTWVSMSRIPTGCGHVVTSRIWLGTW